MHWAAGTQTLDFSTYFSISRYACLPYRYEKSDLRSVSPNSSTQSVSQPPRKMRQHFSWEVGKSFPSSCNFQIRLPTKLPPNTVKNSNMNSTQSREVSLGAAAATKSSAWILRKKLCFEEAGSCSLVRKWFLLSWGKGSLDYRIPLILNSFKPHIVSHV